MVRGKKYQEKLKLVDRQKLYAVGEAVKLVKETAPAAFDEAVDLSIRLGINPKKGEQVRSTLLLPQGTGKTVRVVVLTKGEKLKEAEEAGADFVGGEDLIAKIQGGFLDFDVAIASPDIMGAVGKLGKLLGQKGLMPNPKAGTLTFDIGKTVKEFKAGKVEFRADKSGVVHLPLGKVSFEEGKILDNLLAVAEAIIKAKPVSVKGIYLKSLTLSSSMGPGIKLDPKDVRTQVENRK